MVKHLIACVLLLAPTYALAQPAPDGEREERPRQYGRGGPASERELEEVTAFMRDHAPNRWQAVQSLPEEGSMRRGVIGFVVARYRALQSVREEDPELYTIRLKTLQVEDEIYGLLANTKTAEDREKLRPQLTEPAKKLAELNLAERGRMVQRIKQHLASEEQRLQGDQAQLQTQIDAKVDEMIADGQAALRRDFGRQRSEHRRDRKPTTEPTP